MAQPKFTLVSLKFARDFLKTVTIIICSLAVLQLNSDSSEDFLCLHLHIIIRLCFNKSTESIITMHIISRGRIKHFDISVISTWRNILGLDTY